jgi:hypothetical protein
LVFAPGTTNNKKNNKKRLIVSIVILFHRSRPGVLSIAQATIVTGVTEAEASGTAVSTSTVLLSASGTIIPSRDRSASTAKLRFSELAVSIDSVAGVETHVSELAELSAGVDTDAFELVGPAKSSILTLGIELLECMLSF